jgi:GT2 family glycosyltransferase
MSGARPPVDVVVPVHNQRRLTEACLASVLAADVRTRFELVVVDDASTDPVLQETLTEAAAAGRFKLLTNETNLGFTRSVNRGMRVHPDRDVVLLNNDVVVFDGWLDRLRRAVDAHPRVASVNPLTNASHIGCYPFRVPDGMVRFEVPDADIDAMASEANAERTAEVHTTVGFCMYISRAALDEVGLFDAENFPVGYGEESDFCYRARRLGWRHLIAGDSFVRHWEGQTFASRKARLVDAMIAVFVDLHPELPLKDRDFTERDPVRPLRESLDLARLRRLLGGATEAACEEHSMVPDGSAEPLMLVDREAVTLKWHVPDLVTLPNLPQHRLPQDIAALNDAMRRLGVCSLRFRDAELRDWLTGQLRGSRFEIGLQTALNLAGH